MNKSDIIIGNKYIFKHQSSKNDPFNGKHVTAINTNGYYIEIDYNGTLGYVYSHELSPAPVLLRDSKGRFVSTKQIDKNKYLANSHKCPYCNSTSIEGNSVEIVDGHAYQDIVCMECDKSWTDEYTLTNILEG